MIAKKEMHKNKHPTNLFHGLLNPELQYRIHKVLLSLAESINFLLLTSISLKYILPLVFLEVYFQ